MQERANPFGLALGDLLRVPGISDTPKLPPPAASQPRKLSKGQMILGIIADGLAGATGRPPAFAQHLAQLREQEQQQAQWGLQRSAGLEDYERKRQIDQRYDKPDVSPMERDVAAWGRMGPNQRASYQAMQGMRQGDPDVFVTLPNGQVYAGPKSGLAQALMGGAPQPTAPPRPVGRLTPINGGLTPPASGTFRP